VVGRLHPWNGLLSLASKRVRQKSENESMACVKQNLSKKEKYGGPVLASAVS